MKALRDTIAFAFWLWLFCFFFGKVVERMIELKPCPFCGELPTTRFWVNTVIKGLSIEICCSGCGVKKRLDIECEQTAEVNLLQDGITRITETWNRRANDG